MELKYRTTNENLASIVKGLDIGPEDFILAVGGSLDQSLALVENARKVIAVDRDEQQIQYMKEIMAFLTNENYRGFLEARCGETSNSSVVKEASTNELFEWDHITQGYLTKKRLEKIKEKLSVLEIRKGDIFEVCRNESGFNKVYLSNTLHYDEDCNSTNVNPVIKKLKIAGKNLPPGGLIYSTDGYNLKEILEDGLIFDAYLTTQAWEDYPLGDWLPAVFRKNNSMD